VYYNPHGEKMRLFNEDETGGIFKAHDRASLREALLAASSPMTSGMEEKRDRFMSWHCGENDGRAAHRSAGGLAAIATGAFPRTGSNRKDQLGMWRHRWEVAISKSYREINSRLRKKLSPTKRRLLGQSLAQHPEGPAR
jgi:hypothetical protein